MVMTAICWIIVPIQIVGLLLFRSLRRLLIFQKRYPTMIQLECIACILFLLIGIPLNVHDAFNDSDPFPSSSIQLAVTFGSRILNQILGLFILHIEATRLWLIAYDLHYLRSSQNEKWKCQIDRLFAAKDWYLQNRNRYGNTKYVATRVTIYYLTALFLCISSFVYCHFLGYEYHFISILVEMLFSIVPICFILFVYCKSPKNLNDCSFYHFEYKTTSIAIGIGFQLYFAAAMFDGSGFVRLGHILSFIALLLSLVMPSIVSTVWVPIKINHSLWVCLYVWTLRLVLYLTLRSKRIVPI